MARRVKKPEDYGQLPLFEEKEPDWLKSEDQIGYALEPLLRSSQDVTFDASPVDGMQNQVSVSTDSGDDDDELEQFVDWLQRKK